MNKSDFPEMGILVNRVGVLETRVEQLERLTASLSVAIAPGLADGLPSVAFEAGSVLSKASVLNSAPVSDTGPASGTGRAADAASPPPSQTLGQASDASSFTPPDVLTSASPSAASPADTAATAGASAADDLAASAAASSDSGSPGQSSPRKFRVYGLPDETEAARDAADSSNAAGQKPAESLESRIGLYWLSKLGIGFLVVGVALLIMYSFNYFGPLAKIATGFVVAAALMALGEYLEKRDNIPWYARLLEGGAWALGYFTTYAMYHVESVRIIQDPLTDLILMLGVSGLAIGHAINKRSETMAIFSVTLGFLTLGLSHVSAFSGIASAILVAIAVVLSIRQKWYQLFLYSVFASYGALVACGSLHLDFQGAKEGLTLATLLLAPSLIGFGIVPLYLSEEEMVSKQSLVIGTVVNASAFCLLFFPLAYHYLSSAASVYNLTVGLWFFVVAFLAKRAGAKSTASINSLFGLTVATMYFAGANCGRSSWIFLAFELAILTWSGLRFELKSFRWFAIALGVTLLLGNFALLTQPDSSLILGQYLPFSLCAAITTILAMGASACCQKNQAWQQNASAGERKFAFYTYWNMALIIAWSLPLAMISITFDHLGRIPELMQTPVLLFSWCAIACAVMANSIWICSPYMQVVAILLFASAGLPACATWHFSWINSSLVMAIMFAAAFVFRHYAPRLSDHTSMANFHAQFLIAYCCTALLPVGDQWAGEQISVYWAVQAIIALGLGLKLRDHFIRLIAPVAFVFAIFPMGLHGYDWWSAVPIVTCLYLAWALYLMKGDFGIGQGEAEIRHCYSVVAAVILTNLLGLKLEKTWVSCSWALEGFTILALGFVLREKVMRVTGLCVFATLVCRLLFVDLAGAETIYRIFAFIVAGLVLLLSAYAYSWFAKRFGEVGEAEGGPNLEDNASEMAQ